MPFPESIRLEVLRKAHFACCLCKNVGPIETHHVLPASEGGPDTFENAAPLCPTCHEAYGANPTKRKMIRDARDHWYELCAKRYASDFDRLTQMSEQINAVALKVDALIDGRPKTPSPPSAEEPKEFQGLPLAEVLGRLINERFAGDKDFEVSVRVTYRLLYETTGDEKAKADREFNDTRAEFQRTFGVVGAEAICAHLNKLNKINWVRGVPEPALNRIEQDAFILMVVLLQHEDFRKKDFQTSMKFDSDGTLRTAGREPST